MDRKRWTVQVEGRSRAVTLDWTYWSGHRQVSVDGEVRHVSSLPMRWRSEQQVDVEGHRVLVRTRPRHALSPYFVLELELDGVPVPPDPGPRATWEAA